MANRQKHWSLALKIILVFGLLLGATSILTATVSSAPPAQEQPGEDLYLDYGDDVTRTLYADDESEVFETFVFRVHLPAGSQLTVWLGEDAQGGCYSEGLLFIDGSQVGYTTVGPAPSSWSTPIVATVSTGYAQLAFRAYDDCESWVSFPVEKYVRFNVSSPSAPATNTPTPTVPPTEVPPPTIDFWADQDHIVRGECTTLHWRVENVQAVYYQGGGVSGYGDQQECPQQTTTYELYVVVYQAAEQLIDETRYVTVYVEELPTPTRTPTSRPPTATSTFRPPTATSTRRPPTATPSPRTPTRTPTPEPTAAPSLLVTPPWVLVVTDSAMLDSETNHADAWKTIEGWLKERYLDDIDVLDLFAEHVSRVDYEEIDEAIEARVDTYSDLPTFILIVGGPEVVAFGEVDNPMFETVCCASPDPNVFNKCDCDTIYTDDLYGDFDHDEVNVPDIAVARLPDGGDFELYNVQFSLEGDRTHHEQQGRYGTTLANEARPYASEMAEILGVRVQWSPPIDLESDDASWPVQFGPNGYFILHGADWDTTRWWGDNSLVAWNMDWAEAGLDGTVVAGNCYGAYIGTPGSPTKVTDSIALTYVAGGTEAFIGHTASSYSYRSSGWEYKCRIPLLNLLCSWKWKEEWPVKEGKQYMDYEILRHIVDGEHPLIAYYWAKRALADSLGPDAKLYNKELKGLHSLVYYGLPPAPLRIEF